MRYTIYPGDDHVLLMTKALPNVKVRIDWAPKIPTSIQVVVARRMFAELSNQPLFRILEQAKSGKSLEVGVFAMNTAIELQNEFHSKGLRVSFTEIPE